MKEKFKSFLADDTLYIASIVVGVGVLAFLLGRLSVSTLEQQNAQAVNPLSLCPVTIYATPVAPLATAVASGVAQGQVASASTTSNQTGQYVASKAGTKYHHITCAGAKQIKEENKIYFATVEAALAAGYTKAANCNK